MLLAFFFCALLAACKQDQPLPDPILPDPILPVADTLIRGADLSTLPEVLAAGTLFRDSAGAAADPIALLQAAGMNTVRLRLFYGPATAWQNTDSVAAFARRLHQRGLKVWLTLHYSGDWADPNHQTTPAAWASLTLPQLSDSVYAYTYRVVAAIRPEVVQIGNEINSGLLWPQGHSYHAAQMAALLTQGCNAARAAFPATQTMIHFAGQIGAQAFFDTLAHHAVPYHLVGLSYYPLWHGKSLTALGDSLRHLKARLGKPVYVAETAYPFTLNWNDWTNNIVGDTSHLVPGFAASVSGQAAFLDSLHAQVTAAGGSGWCYWEPTWVAFRGTTAPNGSPWENQALFDFALKPLPGIRAFGR